MKKKIFKMIMPTLMALSLAGVGFSSYIFSGETGNSLQADIQAANLDQRIVYTSEFISKPTLEMFKFSMHGFEQEDGTYDKDNGFIIARTSLNGNKASEYFDVANNTTNFTLISKLSCDKPLANFTYESYAKVEYFKQFSYVSCAARGYGIQLSNYNNVHSEIKNTNGFDFGIKEINFTLDYGNNVANTTNALTINLGNAANNLSTTMNLSFVGDTYEYKVKPVSTAHTYFQILHNISTTVFIDNISIVLNDGSEFVINDSSLMGYSGTEIKYKNGSKVLSAVGSDKISDTKNEDFIAEFSINNLSTIQNEELHLCIYFKLKFNGDFPSFYSSHKSAKFYMSLNVR